MNTKTILAIIAVVAVLAAAIAPSFLNSASAKYLLHHVQPQVVKHRQDNNQHVKVED
jgi:hypothetical protein